MPSPSLRIESDLPALAESVALEILERARRAIAERGRFTWALSGGSSPKTLYRLFATKHRDALDWSKVHLFWGDERHVGPQDPQSNFKMACEAMIDSLPLPSANVHRIEAEKPEADEVARAYERRLAEVFTGSLEPEFDVMLLGMGDDGHTASLFPGTTALDEKVQWVAAPWVEKLNTFRITLTYPVLNASRAVIFFVSGADKAPALKDVLENPRSVLPSARVKPKGELLWRVDEAAAAQLSGQQRG